MLLNFYLRITEASEESKIQWWGAASLCGEPEDLVNLQS